VLAEGTRGSLTKKLVEKKKLDKSHQSGESYGIGIKECGTYSRANRTGPRGAHAGVPVSMDMYGGG